jgi:hypothetical protein
MGPWSLPRHRKLHLRPVGGAVDEGPGSAANGLEDGYWTYPCGSSDPDGAVHGIVWSTTETVVTTCPPVRVRHWMGMPGRFLANQKTSSVAPSRTV